MEDVMQAYIQLILKPLETRETEEKETKKSSSRFSMFNKLMRRSVTYYDDEELRKMGSPYIWTE